MKKISPLFALILSVFILSIPLAASGQDATHISFGKLKIIPGVEGQVVYDDNIYMKNGKDDVANKKVSDTIFHVKPGLLLTYDLPERGSLKLGWSGDWAFYNNQVANNWNNQSVIAGIDYAPPQGLILGVNNEWRFAQDPYGGPNQYGIGRTTSRWMDTLGVKVGNTWGASFRTILLYDLYTQQYTSKYDYSQNYTTNKMGLSVEGLFLPKTWGFMSYSYGMQQFGSFNGEVIDGVFFPGVADNRKADNKFHQINGGLKWDPGSKLSGALSFGYQFLNYDNNLDGSGNSRSNVDTWIAATNINFAATEKTNLSLNITRAVQNQGSNSNIYFMDTSIGISVQQKFLAKFAANAGFTFSMNDYNTVPTGVTRVAVPVDKREDRNYIFNVGLDYMIREWITFGIAYKYNQKTSNYSDFEFTDNQYLASLKIVY